MEELSRLHKDVPFGWFLVVQNLLAARRGAPAPRQTTRYAPTERFVVR